FFFQAEDGIRDDLVTGVQTCALPIYWNAPNLQPMDPVTLGLCSQIDLDLEVHRAAKEKPVDVEAQGATLLPASETTIRPREPEPEEKPSEEMTVDSVFAKLKQIGGKSE